MTTTFDQLADAYRAGRLGYPNDTYNALIRAIALLHQHQRPKRSVTNRGKELRYIEVTEADIMLANRLASEVLGRTLDELPPQTRVLLSRIHRWAAAECERLALRRCDLRFTRRQIREVTGWGDTQLKVHLSRLAELEYVLVHRAKAGQGHEYELLYDGEGEAGERFLMGLAGPGIQPYDDHRSGSEAVRSAPGRGAVGGRSGGGRAAESVPAPQQTALPDEDDGDAPKTPFLRANGNGSSYPHPVAASA